MRSSTAPRRWCAQPAGSRTRSPSSIRNTAPATASCSATIAPARWWTRWRGRSDSQYLVRTMNDGWRRTKNLDLWQQLDREVARHDVRFEWVRGHAGDALNEEADALAREATRTAAKGRGPRRSTAAGVTAG